MQAFGIKVQVQNKGEQILGTDIAIHVNKVSHKHVSKLDVGGTTSKMGSDGILQYPAQLQLYLQEDPLEEDSIAFLDEYFTYIIAIAGTSLFNLKFSTIAKIRGGGRHLQTERQLPWQVNPKITFVFVVYSPEDLGLSKSQKLPESVVNKIRPALEKIDPDLEHHLSK